MDELYIQQHDWEMAQEASKKEKVTLDSFHTLTVIGKGSYAKVLLVRKKDNNKI